jgi:hypothetical protein
MACPPVSNAKGGVIFRLATLFSFLKHEIFPAHARGDLGSYGFMT